MKKVLGIFAIALAGGLVALGINNVVERITEPASFEAMQKKHAIFASNIESGGNVGFDFVKVSEVSTPAVVHIKSYKEKAVRSTHSSSSATMDLISMRLTVRVWLQALVLLSHRMAISLRITT
jgi:hypothetical protein